MNLVGYLFLTGVALSLLPLIYMAFLGSILLGLVTTGLSITMVALLVAIYLDVKEKDKERWM